MRKQLTFYLMLGLTCFSLHAQTEFTLTASDLVPHDDGFFLKGVDFDFNGDGIVDHAQGCPTIDFDTEDYERRDPGNVTYDLHIESGEQLGFMYQNTMILPVCDGKYASILEPAISKGFIQLRPGIDTSDVNVATSYIRTPLVRNIVSVTLEVSADVSIQVGNRHIPFNIEVSTDGGKSYLFEPWVFDAIDDDTNKGGFRVTYDETDESMKEIIDLSKDKNVYLRLITNNDFGGLGANKGQYLKVHKFTVVADEGTEEPTDTLLSNFEIAKPLNFYVKDGYVGALQGEVSVYTIAGKLVGKGERVRTGKGLFMVMTSDLKSKKIFIQ